MNTFLSFFHYHGYDVYSENQTNSVGLSRLRRNTASFHLVSEVHRRQHDVSQTCGLFV